VATKPPINTFLPPLPVRPLSDLREETRWFRAFLTKGLGEAAFRRADTKLAEALAMLNELDDAVRHGRPPGPALRDPGRFSDALSCARLIRALRTASDAKVQNFDKKIWRAFLGDFVLRGRARVPEEPTSRDARANTVWEIYVAAIAALIDPSAELRDRPDVSVKIRDDLWGIECKVMYSANPSENLSDLAHAAEVIQRSDVHRGLIAVNLSPRIQGAQYEASLRSPDRGGPFPSAATVIDDLVRQTQAVFAAIENQPGFPDRLDRDRRTGAPRTKTRLITYHADCIARVGNTVSVVTAQFWSVYQRPSSSFTGPKDAEDDRMINRYHAAVGTL
jgi:hypothetical protein